MAGLTGFTDNPFQSRSDLSRAATALIQPLIPYRSSTGARVKIRPSTFAAFDDVAAQLEGFARPLWAITAILENSTSGALGFGSWLSGLQAGVDPGSADFWGDVGPCDQRMVEMESIAFALLTAPEDVTAMLSEDSGENLKNWLLQINHHAMPKNNWRWFRVLVNLALSKVLGVPHSELKQRTDQDFALLDQFYLGEGWSSDGVWGDERKQADYYSGSFAIQFAQLLYVCFAQGDEERVERYRQQAREFSTRFWRYFDVNGAAIPHGRSMTYRFAFAAFWAAVALADIQLPAPMDSPGSVKGMLLRHLRWWAKHPDIFNSDGTLTIGFTYPNMYLSEDYNSPQSVYWCLKSFVVLGVPESHPFWTCEEQPHPMAALTIPKQLQAQALSLVQVNWPPRHILCTSPEHHFLLSSGQMTTKSFKAREAKYGKLAYSSAFAFSVPTGPSLHQMAPDSTLSLSLDDGETWRVRWKPFNVRIEPLSLDMGQGIQETVPSLVSVWKPFTYLNLEIETTLIPVVQHFPGWHIRVHEVRGLESSADVPWCTNVQVIDASFAISALTSAGYHVPQLPAPPSKDSCVGSWKAQSSTLVMSKAGASGIIDLTSPEICSNPKLGGAILPRASSKGFLIEADPNTNLISQRTFIPSIKHCFEMDSTATVESAEKRERLNQVVVSGVFAASSLNLQQSQINQFWNRRPQIKLDSLGKWSVGVE
ncbi:hypothetical protein BGZ61DRAFT_358184 [Ilyonectria robusta]|uniref:uncharacterized protein n=1 Tax=Ilyonectria robusta TaxID=1079257 RepID=UPI001E8ECFBE|nr:uncharacterized protein BGZ61DRAFT_358184 [Ilyonectria robusta]KAH8683614.1 hypothetical protein BGZ61DRAFT_358184 [Ilyonectria robusta]